MTRHSNDPTDRNALTRRQLFALGAAALAVPWREAAAQSPSPGPAVWLDMDQAALDSAYDQSVYAPNMAAVQAQHAAMNAAARERLQPPLRYRYGTAPVEGLDLYRAVSVGAPILVFIHGGTWRFNTSTDYAFIAEPFVRAGTHVAVLDFAAVEEAADGLLTLVDQVRRAVGWLYENAAQFGGDARRLFVAGHSSGGHLAGAALTTDWTGDYGLPADLLRGGLCISGMFDLEPVRLSWRNDYLGLDERAVGSLSPQRHIEQLRAPVVVAYGSNETPEFQRQSRDFARAVRDAGKPVELLVGESLNHFEMLGTLANHYGLAGYAAMRQLGLS